MSVTIKPNGYVINQTLANCVDLSSFNALIVGGTNGIGKALTESLLKRKASVTIVGRSEPKDITGNSLFKATFVKADLSSLKVAKETANKLKDNAFDAYIFTNGILPSSLTRTSEGIESDLAVSTLSRFVMINEFLANGLGQKRRESGLKPKIFIMGFPGAKTEAKLEDFNWEKSYNYLDAHFNTVAANETIQRYLANKYKSSLTVIGLNPGLIKTGIRSDVLRNPIANWFVEGVISLIYPTPEQYAEKVLINLVADKNIDEEYFTGTAFDQKGNEILPNSLLTEEVQSKIISFSEELVKKAGASSE